MTDISDKSIAEILLSGAHSGLLSRALDGHAPSAGGRAAGADGAAGAIADASMEQGSAKDLGGGGQRGGKFGAGRGDRLFYFQWAATDVVRSARLSGGRPTVSILTCQSDLNRSWQVNEKAKAGLKSKGRALNFIPIGETDEAEHK